MKYTIVLFFMFSISIKSFTQNLDINILKELNVNRNESLDPSFRFITNSGTPISIATPVIIFGTSLLTKDSSLRQKSYYLAEAFLASAVISLSMKFAIKRDRPFVTYPFIEKASSGGSYSFPSGHTSTAFATATSLSIAFPKWYVIAPSMLWASSVGYSRMHLGVHYPSDVLAGAIVGAGSAWLTYKLNEWYRNKRTEKFKI